MSSIHVVKGYSPGTKIMFLYGYDLYPGTIIRPVISRKDGSINAYIVKGDMPGYRDTPLRVKPDKCAEENESIVPLWIRDRGPLGSYTLEKVKYQEVRRPAKTWQQQERYTEENGRINDHCHIRYSEEDMANLRKIADSFFR